MLTVWTLEFLRSLGLDDELIAHVLASPEEKRGRELRLALLAMADEQAGARPRKKQERNAG